jgi:hypothetical protein
MDSCVGDAVCSKGKDDDGKNSQVENARIFGSGLIQVDQEKCLKIGLMVELVKVKMLSKNGDNCSQTITVCCLGRKVVSNDDRKKNNYFLFINY